MLEEQVAKLDERMSAVEAHGKKTTELLAEILATLRGGKFPPVQEGEVIDLEAEKVEAVSDKKKPADKPKPADNSNEPETPQTVKEFAEEVSHDIDDVRQAFLAAKEAVGKETAIGAVVDITGPIKNISHVPEDKFADVISALGDLAQQEAA